MKTITRYAYVLHILTYLFASGMILWLCMRWLGDVAGFPTDLYARFNYHWQDDAVLQVISAISGWVRVIGFIINGILVALFICGLVYFNRFITTIRHHAFFSPDATHALKKVSTLALCAALYNPLRGMLVSIITTLHKGPGQHMISLSISASDLLAIGIFALLVIFIAIIDDGTKLKQEHDATV